MPDTADYVSTTDPAKAFTELCAEVTILRKGIEALRDAIVENRPPVYGEDFGVIGEGLDEIFAQLTAIQKFPALNMTPAEAGQSIANAGTNMFREAVQKLSYVENMAERERENLK